MQWQVVRTNLGKPLPPPLAGNAGRRIRHSAPAAAMSWGGCGNLQRTNVRALHHTHVNCESNGM